MRIAVIGHAEHVTIGRVAALPSAGDIVHLEAARILAGGGGAIAFFQLVNSDAEVHFFTAIGDDDAGRAVEAELARTGAALHLARRPAPHTRDVVMVDPRGERTIVVVGAPHHPRLDDPLPWSSLAGFDAVYFTADDPAVLAAARAARVLVATARRKQVIDRARLELDLIVGSRADPREKSARADYVPPPRALVMTEGAAGGWVETDAGRERFSAPQVDRIAGGAYGAGDSFAAALTYFLAGGAAPHEAARLAAPFGAAVLAALNPLDAQRSLRAADT